MGQKGWLFPRSLSLPLWSSGELPWTFVIWSIEGASQTSFPGSTPDMPVFPRCLSLPSHWSVPLGGVLLFERKFGHNTCSPLDTVLGSDNRICMVYFLHLLLLELRVRDDKTFLGQSFHQPALAAHHFGSPFSYVGVAEHNLECSGYACNTFGRWSANDLLWRPIEKHLCFIGSIPCLEDLSTSPGRWLVTRPGRCGADTLRLVDVIKDWLSCFSSSDSLDQAVEVIDSNSTDVGA